MISKGTAGEDLVHLVHLISSSKLFKLPKEVPFEIHTYILDVVGSQAHSIFLTKFIHAPQLPHLLGLGCHHFHLKLCLHHALPHSDTAWDYGVRQDLKLVRAECVCQRNEVAIKLGIISLSLLSLSRHLLNLQERVVVGFPNFAWASN
jgi:hypothetical protein